MRNGKIDKKHLIQSHEKQEHQEGTIYQNSLPSKQISVSTEKEETTNDELRSHSNCILYIFQQVLESKVNSSDIDAESDFFSVGGDSALAIQAINSINSLFSYKMITFPEFLVHRSASSIANLIINRLSDVKTEVLTKMDETSLVNSHDTEKQKPPITISHDRTLISISSHNQCKYMQRGNEGESTWFNSPDYIKSRLIPSEASISLTFDWSFDLFQCVDASPLVVNGEKVIIGSHSGFIACIDLHRGIEIWRADLGHRIESSAIISVDASRIVVGCYNGAVHTLSVQHGEILWSFLTEADIKATPRVDSTTGTCFSS